MYVYTQGRHVFLGAIHGTEITVTTNACNQECPWAWLLDNLWHHCNLNQNFKLKSSILPSIQP